MSARLRLQHAVSLLLAVGLFAGVMVAAFLALDYRWNWAGMWKWRGMFVWGWLVTLGIAAVALPVSGVFGLLLALARRSRWLPLVYISRTYVELARGTPLLVQIYIYFYVFGPPLGLYGPAVWISGQAVDLNNRYVNGTLALAAFSGAYLSEIIRAGIESVGKSQLESARAIGLTTGQTYRYVIFPQAIRQILPGVAGQFVSLIKDSSLLSVIAVNEFFQAASNVNAAITSPFESYLPLALGYLLLTFPLSMWIQGMERRWRYET